MKTLELVVFTFVIGICAITAGMLFPENGTKALAAFVAIGWGGIAAIAWLFDYIGWYIDKDNDDWPHYGGHTGE